MTWTDTKIEDSGATAAGRITASEWNAMTTDQQTKATIASLAAHTSVSTIHFTQGAISIPASQISDFDTEVSNNSSVAANTSKVTNATHTGEVTGATALTVADNIIDEANLKLPAGPTNDYVLTADSGESGGMKWAVASGGSSPLTTKGDLYGYSTTDARLPIGTNDYVLTADSGETLGLKWAAASSGFSDPMTTRGDIIYKDSSNITNRLATGTSGQILTSDGTDTSWETRTQVPTIVIAQDGTGDYNGTNQTPFVSALADIATNGGGHIYVKEGTYTFTTGLNIGATHEDMTIEGTGWGTILKMGNAGNDQVFELTSTDRIVIKNLKIDGNGSNQTSNVWGIICDGCDDIKIHNVWIFQPGGGCVEFKNQSTRCIASNCRGEDRQDPNSSTADLFLINRSTYCSFVDCIAQGTTQTVDNCFGVYTGTSISAADVKGASIINCKAYAGAGNGINIEDGEDVIIDGCLTTGQAGSGIHVTNTDSVSDGVTITGCTSYGNTDDGIELNNGTNIVVSGCIIHSNTDNGIYVGADYVNIASNQIFENGDDGLGAYQTHFLNITGNYFNNNNINDNSKDHIKIDGCDNGVISGNMITSPLTQKVQYGINMVNTCDYFIITGNQLYDSIGAGMNITVGSYCTITGNIITNCSYGVRTQGASDYNIVSGNTFRDNSSTDISLVGSNNEIGHNIVI